MVMGETVHAQLNQDLFDMEEDLIHLIAERLYEEMDFILLHMSNVMMVIINQVMAVPRHVQLNQDTVVHMM